MNRLQLLFVLVLLISFGSLVQAQTTIFQDNFNDGSIADWDVNSGSWSAATLKLVGGTLDGATISHTAAMPSNYDYNITYKNNPNNVGLSNTFAWLTDQNGLSNFTGYRIVLSTTALFLQRANGAGSFTNLISKSMAITAVDHNIAVYHRSDGNIMLWFDGTSQGTVIDTTYQSGNRILIGTTNAGTDGIWDDILITQTQQDLNFYVVDEEDPTNPLTGSTITINGSPWPQNANGSFDVNESITFPATITITKSGYDTRSFDFDTNAGLYMIKRLGLRQEDEAKNIDFKFYAPDDSTVLSNRWIYVFGSSGGQTFLSGRAKTNSIGQITFNLAPQDSAYDFNIFVAGTDFGDSNVQYKYDAVTVTVNQARDERTNALIVNPFNLDVGGLGLQNYTNQNLPFSTIVILGNTESVYSLRVVDSNSIGQQYFARNYIMQTKGDDTSLTIQPYLLDLDDGILTNITVFDTRSNLTIPDIRITLKKGIGGSLVTVEDTTTDITGIAQVVMQSQTQYDFNVTNPDQSIGYLSGLVGPVSTQISFYINYTSVDTNFGPKNIFYSISPLTDTLSGTTQQIDFNISADFAYENVFVQALDNNTIISSTSSSTNPFQSNLVLTLADFNSQNVTLKIIVVSPDNNTVLTKTYIILSTNNGGILNLLGLRQSLGPTNIVFFLLIALVGMIAFIGPGVLGNNDSQVFVGAIGLGIISFLFLREFFVFVIGALFVGALGWMWVRVNR